MIFLMSSERSGSNMLRVIMSRHSMISAPPPPHLVMRLMPVLPAYGCLSREANFRRLVADARAILDSQLGDWTSSFEVEQILSRVDIGSFSSLLRVLYGMEAQSEGKTLSFVKDNGNIRWPLHLYAMFNDAKFVYLVRDPRDYVLSWLRSPTHVGGVGAAARVWQEEQQSGLTALAGIVPDSRILLVKYENLVSDPATELDKICAFLEIEPEPSMLEDLGSNSHRAEAKRIANWENVASGVKRTNFGKFHDGLSARQVRHIERLLACEMQILEYRLKFPEIEPRVDGGVLGKLYRAAVGSLRLLVGGKDRRDELAIRIRRLRALRKIRNDVRRAPGSLVVDRDSES